MRLILILTALLTFQSAAASEFDDMKALAELGFADAQYNLALMYANGKGESWPQDSGQSDKWINAPFFGIVDAVEGAKNDQKTSP